LYFGINQDELTIVIDSDESNDILFTWNLRTNTENEGYDLGKEYELVYSEHGSLHIINKGQVYFTNQGSSNRAFGVEEGDVENSMSEKF